jgi:hypothetical protein
MLNKLKLDDLKVQSFITELDEQHASQIVGGIRAETRVSECIEGSIQICESESQDTFCYVCGTN